MTVATPFDDTSWFADRKFVVDLTKKRRASVG